jgi:hypothetical protein
MNRLQTALFTALDAVIAVAVGIGAALVPLTIVWVAHYELAIDWAVFWRAAADTWLLGNGVNMTVTIDPAAAAMLAVPGAEQPFSVTIAPLGFALLAIFLGVRTGLRSAATPYRRCGAIAAITTYGIFAVLITISAQHFAAIPVIWQGVVFPTAIYAIAVMCGAEVEWARRNETTKNIELTGNIARLFQQEWERIPELFRAVGAIVVRAGIGVAVALISVAALIVAVLIIANYPTIISLYEGIHADVVGGIALTVAQLAFLPNLVIWAASWLIGPGFAIGTGTSISPAGNIVGSLPGLPVFGALPNGDSAFGLVGILVPVLAGFLIGLRAHRPLVSLFEGKIPMPWMAGSATAIGVIAGIFMGIVAWWSGGAAGPGTLINVGPHPWSIGGILTGEVAIASFLGIFSASFGPINQLVFRGGAPANRRTLGS